MNQGGAPLGNKNAAKAKAWEGALRATLAQFEDEKTKPGEALRKIAERLLDEAAAGNVQALKEVADRLDGKVPQGIEGGDPDRPVRMDFGWLPPSE